MRGLVLEPCFRLSNQLTKSDDKRADDAGKNRGLLSVALAGLQFASIGEMNSRDISRPCGLLFHQIPFSVSQTAQVVSKPLHLYGERNENAGKFRSTLKIPATIRNIHNIFGEINCPAGFWPQCFAANHAPRAAKAAPVMMKTALSFRASGRFPCSSA